MLNRTVYFHPSKSKKSENRTPPSFWTTVEVSVSVQAACLPPLGPLIRRTPGPKTVGSVMRKGFFSSFSLQLSGSKKRIEGVSSGERGDEEAGRSGRIQSKHPPVEMVHWHVEDEGGAATRRAGYDV